MRGEPTTAAGARYHPEVIWGPFLLALALGLVVSAGLYFAYLWPQVEPDEDDHEDVRASGDPRAGAPGEPTVGTGEATPEPSGESSPA
jgi:hypothetical protein